jgi:hypothetical protein
MHKHRFQIEDCCGRLVDTIEIEVDDNFDFYNSQYDILSEAGYKVQQCESCYDSTYRLVDCGPA